LVWHTLLIDDFQGQVNRQAQDLAAVRLIGQKMRSGRASFNASNTEIIEISSMNFQLMSGAEISSQLSLEPKYILSDDLEKPKTSLVQKND